MPASRIDTLECVPLLQAKCSDRHPAYQAGLLAALYAKDGRDSFGWLYLGLTHIRLPRTIEAAYAALELKWMPIAFNA